MTDPAHNNPTVPPSVPDPKRPWPAAPTLEQPGDDIGPYRLLSVLGEGGFGVVYLAERREPMVQRVAVKIIKPGMDSRAVIARFEQERQALAVMDHPNVARVIDAGSTPHGRPYFVMEFVQGEPITHYCDRHRLNTRQRLELFIPVCEAVQHAHMKGLIHRDLKPSNVLVATTDSRPIPKVIDFGVAKAISQTLTQKTLFTEQGQLIGTPEYMSPEQAEMGGIDVDTRTDVYSLGVLLYELLTGALPFDAASLRSAGLAEIQRIIREVDPPRPSTRLSGLGDSAAEIARKRHAELGALQRELTRELEWIPLKAMRKERTKRYRTPTDLADDVRNYLAGLPLTAGPEKTTYILRKFIRRRRGLVAAVAAVAVALLAGIIGTSTGLVIARRAADSERAARRLEAAERDRAEKALAAAQQAAEAEREARQREASQRSRAEATSTFLHDMLSSIDPEKASGRDITVREIIDDAASKVGPAFKDDPVAEASMRETLGETYHQLARYPEAREQLRLAYDLRVVSLGPDDRETLTSKYNIAAVAIALRDVDEARRLLTETLEARRRTLGEDAEDTLVTRSLLGFAAQLAGDEEGALAIYRETAAAQKQALGPGAKPTLETLCSIADVLQDLGRLNEAESVAREAAEAATLAQGPDGSTTLTARSILAAILKDLSRYEESETLSRAILDSRRRIYGPDHTETLITENVLALTLELVKKYDEASQFARHASDAAATTLGPAHSVTLSYLANLARIEQLRGNLDEAERIMRQVLEVRLRDSGEDAQATLVVMNNLGLLLLDRKKPDEAEPIFRRMLAGIERVLPEDHWMRGQARINVAECLSDQGKFEESQTLMLAGYAQMEQVLPAGHSRLENSAKSIANMYKAWGKPEQEATWRAKAAPKPADSEPAPKP
ncbi:MAG: serine/threonine protein kinase [Phycisphaeraceae bacterium]|nr:serine/threonine protein kinase [Phycisphaeraceae bacterium]